MNAAVRFTPEMTVEFSKMASKLNQLKEEVIKKIFFLIFIIYLIFF